MITAIRVPKAIIKDNASKTDILSPPDEQRKPTHRLSEGYYSISYYKNKCDCDRKQICLSGKNHFSRFAFKYVLKAFNLFAGKNPHKSIFESRKRAFCLREWYLCKKVIPYMCEF